MFLLLVSLAALASAPLVAPALHRHPTLGALTDGFIVAGILTLTAGHIVPHSVALGGPTTLIAWAIGLVVPALAHGGHRSCAKRQMGPLVGFAIVALGIHALLDGVALTATDSRASWYGGFGFAVAMHRLLEGLSIWWLTQGSRAATRMAALAGSGLATLLGYALGMRAQAVGLTEGVGLLQAAAAGSLLHVVAHHPPENSPIPKGRFAPMASSLGACLALALVVGIGEPEHIHEAGHLHEPIASISPEDPHPSTFFTDTALTVGFAALMALFWTGLEHAWHPHGPRRKQGAGSSRSLARLASDATRGAWRGVTSSLCACGVLPLLASERSRGASSAEASAYVLAAPALGPCALILSLYLMGWQLTLMRLAGILALALIMAISAHLWAPTLKSHVFEEEGRRGCARPEGVTARLFDGASFASGDVLAFLAPWLLLGLTLANTLGDSVQSSWLMTLTASGLGPWLCALLAAPFYICSAASTLVGAVLLRLGASPGTVLTLVLISSSISWTGGEALAQILRRQRAIALFIAMLVGSAVIGTLTDLCYLPTQVTWGQKPLNPLETGIGLTGILVLGWGIFRQGVRGVIDQWASPNRRLASHHHHHA